MYNKIFNYRTLSLLIVTLNQGGKWTNVPIAVQAVVVIKIHKNLKFMKIWVPLAPGCLSNRNLLQKTRFISYCCPDGGASMVMFVDGVVAAAGLLSTIEFPTRFLCIQVNMVMMMAVNKIN